jgi:PAS domain S-box-containing protein
MDDLYRRLLQFTRDGVYRYTWADGRILLANRGLVVILGLDCDPEGIIGKRLRELLIYTEREGTVRRALEERGEIHGFDYHFKTLQGKDKWVIHDSFVSADPETGEKIVEAIVKDVTEKRLAEQAATAERERLRVTLQSIGDGVIATDAQGVVTLLNGVAEGLTGWGEAEAVGRPLTEVLHIVNELTRAPCEDPVARVIRTGMVVGLANHTVLVARDGRERIIADSGAPIRDAAGRVIGTVLVFRDVTGQRAAEKAQRQQEVLLRMIVTNVPIVLFAVDRDGRFTLSEGRGLDSLGRRPGESVGKCVYDLYAHVPRIGENIRRVLGGEEFVDTVEVAGLFFETRYVPLRDGEGPVTGAIGVSMDVTERQRADAAVRASLREKEVLLKEIHHRVKNNMQVIHSLLSLQARHTRDPHALEVLTESQNRVRSMALVHEKLYQSQDLARINFREYVQKLGAELLRTYRIAPQTVTLAVDIEPVELGLDAAVPCGLIISELVTNCLRHAFPDGRTGTVRVGLHGAGEALALTVADDGAGLPEALDIRRSATLGLQLVNTLVDQMDGTIAVDRNGGTTVRITFRKPPAAGNAGSEGQP